MKAYYKNSFNTLRWEMTMENKRKQKRNNPIKRNFGY